MKKVWKVLWPWMLDVAVMVLAGWLMLGCSTKRVVQSNSRAVHDTEYVQHGVRDSVRWQTMLRDSVRIKDSTVVSYSLRQRDSVVLRVDAATGNVVGRDSWHWSDNDASREHFGGVDRATSKGDSLSSVSMRTDSVRVPVEQKVSRWEQTGRKVKDLLAVIGAIGVGWIVVAMIIRARGKI